MVDLDAVAEELYAASPDEFVERRKVRVTEARAAKDRQLVKDIGALRRPTRSAWLVNLLSRESSDEVAELLALGAALGEAQQRASGADLRRLSKDRHAMLEKLTREAVQLGVQHGHTATEATRQEVTQTLQAALSDPSVAELLQAGRVIQPATYGGFGPMDLFGTTAAEPSDIAPDAAPDHGPAQDPDENDEKPPEQPPEDPARIRAESALREAEQTLAESRAAAEDAERAASEATTRADELADRVESLRTQLAEAETAEREAGEAARAARKRHQQAQQVAGEAEARLAEAEHALETLKS